MISRVKKENPQEFFVWWFEDGISDLKNITIKDIPLFMLNESLSKIFPDVFTATIIFITPYASHFCFCWKAIFQTTYAKIIKNYLHETLS